MSDERRPCRGDECRRQAMVNWAYCNGCATKLLCQAWGTGSDPLPQLVPSITEPSRSPRTESGHRSARGDH